MRTSGEYAEIAEGVISVGDECPVGSKAYKNTIAEAAVWATLAAVAVTQENTAKATQALKDL